MNVSSRTAVVGRLLSATGTRPCQGQQRGVVRCVPPTAAERTKQGCDVRESLHVRLHLGERGILILLLGRQNLQLGVPAGPILRDGEIPARACRISGPIVRDVALAVVLQGSQCVRDLDESCDHRTSIHCLGLPVLLLGLLLACGEGSTMKQRGAEIRSNRPDTARAGQELVELCGLFERTARKC